MVAACSDRRVDIRRNMTLALRLLVLAACGLVAASFFDFLKSGSAKPERVVQAVDTNPVRGAPERLHSKYLADQFTCDGKVHSPTIVNDGYCDCADKSDEPGTSACDGGIFHCINKGYKMIKIPASRVDDQVCDCCDGSDEGRVAQCANTCDEAAQRERAQLEKVTNNYKAGSAIREQLIKTVKEEKAQLSASATPLGMEIHRLKEDVDAIQAQLDEKLNLVKSVEADVGTQQRAELRRLLQLDDLEFAHLAHFLSNLLKSLHVDSHGVKEAVAAPAGTAITAAAAAGAEDDEDTELDATNRFGEADPEEDGYESEGETIDVDVNAAGEASTAPLESGTACAIVAHTQDSYLEPLCDVVKSEANAIEAIVNVILKRRAFNHAMLLLGYFKLNQSFIGSDEFTKTQIQTAPDACPEIFAAIPSDPSTDATHCALKEAFVNSVDAVETHYGLPDMRAEIETLRTQVRERNIKIRDVETKLTAAQSADEEVAKHAEHLEYLALKDQCFEKEDGAFVYKLCVLDSIKQREVVGHREVTLGQFQAIEPAYDSAPVDGIVPSVVMKFTRGDHCHAFGARTATVTVTCAERHALISASEPSTCAYKLHFESPAACTPKYAEASGISSLVQE